MLTQCTVKLCLPLYRTVRLDKSHTEKLVRVEILWMLLHVWYFIQCFCVRVDTLITQKQEHPIFVNSTMTLKLRSLIITIFLGIFRCQQVR
jgi:hypothetical protein